MARATYEKFARAKELTAQRSVESMGLARDLYWICLAHDPGFAGAWAWLGRCYWFLDKFSSSSSANMELAQAAFLLQQSVEAHRRATELDPAIITSVAHTLF